MSLRSMSNTGRERREEELPPRQILYSLLPPTTGRTHCQRHIYQRERESVCVWPCVRGSSSISWCFGDRWSKGTAGHAEKERGWKTSRSRQTAALHHNKRGKHSAKAGPPATRAIRKAPVFWSWVVPHCRDHSWRSHRSTDYLIELMLLL